ncbi:hypothetical protein [Corynebacterium coyleae]|uniref:hypothetical protein n=1 Tax=Corynebacterium coyleae TaxID=53374 RepID=UPI002551492B|nr:hypothetical protein [Corynebacterium coyleae]MDK8242591.1 hypothetical protein [Corynebacterium coyleae]
MPVAPLLAPGGVEMRVVSQVAAFTWGSWSVSWPEGFEPPDPPAEDRELGWVADLGGVEVEPFGRCFVRADAQIDATLGRSNVEDVLDAAKYRTSGEVFLETEIPFENLAGQLPYRDFDVNSLVPVRVGGRILENQLVTKVEESEDEVGDRRASVYIGGQKFQDREALRTANREIDRVIAQERLERGDEIGARLAASQEYEREQRDNLKKYVDSRDEEDLAAAKQHAEDEDKKLKRAVDKRVGPEGKLTRLLDGLNADYQSKLGENGSVIADQAAHQRMLSGIVHGTPVSELEGTAFRQQQQAVNEMNDVFRDKQVGINKGFEHLFETNEKVNLVQDYTIKYNRILAKAAEAHMFREVCDLFPVPNSRDHLEGRWPVDGKGGISRREARDVFDGYVSASEVSIELKVDESRLGRANIIAFCDVGVFPRRDQSKRVSYQFGNWSMRFGIVGGGHLGFQMDRGLMGEVIANGGCRIILSGAVFFWNKLPEVYQEQLDALSAEYRAKGLRV